ncbi:MAG: hypothetical protein VXZ72_01975 [Chlamydiota bacterium]|nr:hypothetical protein [Chlamydiota bacterium]
MVILGVLAVGTLGAISGRAAVNFLDAVFTGVEEYPRVSEHNWYGHQFRCTKNSEFEMLETAVAILDTLAVMVVDKANLEEADTAPMKKFLLEGALLWGTSGMDIRAVILSKLADASLAQDVAMALAEAVENLSPSDRHVLFALHTLAV